MVWDLAIVLASLGFCVIVPSDFVDSPSLLQGKRCWLLVAFERRTDCGFALTPTAGSQLSVGPRYDFDLHLTCFISIWPSQPLLGGCMRGWELSAIALASLSFCVIVSSGFVDSPSLHQGKRCRFLTAFWSSTRARSALEQNPIAKKIW